jgi:gamma-glutamyltranspeptidase/glutathione hydrolase
VNPRGLHHTAAAWATALAAVLLLGACAARPPLVPALPGGGAVPAAPAAVPPVASQAASQATPTPPAGAVPEGTGGGQAQPGWTFQRQAVAAAHPLAAEAGAQVLREGGSAPDAAIAAQAVLAVVEPQSSGLGGGAFLLLWSDGRLRAFDGREIAPAAAEERLFLGPDGRPLAMAAAQVGGRAVGVPGLLRMLAMAHRDHGRLPWARLFAPAIALADGGFALGPRLHALLRGDPALRSDPLAAALFFGADGQPLPVGTRLRNPALAEVLRRVAQHGADALHAGPLAQDIVARVQGHAANPGRLTLQDMAGYTPVERAPLCADWGPRWRVCGFPPPSSGQIALMQILGLLDRLGATVPPPGDAPRPGATDAGWLHAYTEASRLAFADRAQFVADPAFVPAPGGDWRTLLAAPYLAARAALVGPRSAVQAPAGEPAPLPAGVAFAPMPEMPASGTSHISAVDARGGAVALTTSIEAVFGARLMSDGGTGLPGGFLLNNQLTDFAFAPTDAAGRPVANRLQPGKRPRSSMSPTLVFDRRTNEVVGTLGGALGPFIIHGVARVLLAHFAWGMDLQSALDLPNFASLNGPTLLEAGRFDAATLAALRALGHPLAELDLPTGMHAIVRTPQGWRAAADPRREGAARGD